jgi:ribosome-associated protein
MQEKTIQLRPGKENLELSEALHIFGIGQTGGQCKLLIQSGQIKLNGEIELRKRKKLASGDIIEYNSEQFKLQIIPS